MSFKTMFIAAGIVWPVFYVQATEIHPTETQLKESTTLDAKWQGGVELGFVATKGNTDTQSTNAKLTIGYLVDKWKQKFKADALRSEDKGVVTAEHFSFQFRSQYDFKEKEFMFGSLRYEENAFSGFESRTTEVIGYGYEVYNSITFMMDLELGVTARQTRLTDGTIPNEAIMRTGSHMDRPLPWFMIFKMRQS